MFSERREARGSRGWSRCFLHTAPFSRGLHDYMSQGTCFDSYEAFRAYRCLASSYQCSTRIRRGRSAAAA